MPERKRIVDGRGRIWTVSKVSWPEAEEEDFRYWHEELTREQRVDALPKRWKVV